jgi:hypothetical protein
VDDSRSTLDFHPFLRPLRDEKTAPRQMLMDLIWQVQPAHIAGRF